VNRLARFAFDRFEDFHDDHSSVNSKRIKKKMKVN
jgi:hypothetical protein